jgi:hypothetical protein
MILQIIKIQLEACMLLEIQGNVITSIKNHYQLDDEKAIQWIGNKENYIYDVQNFEESGYGDFQYISSWSLNYKSWKVQKKIPIKFIKYEDLLDKTYIIFLEIIEFINKITNNSKKIDKVKLKKVLRTTSFDALKKNEIDKGFSEAITYRENKNKKIPFFSSWSSKMIGKLFLTKT